MKKAKRDYIWSLARECKPDEEGKRRALERISRAAGDKRISRGPLIGELILIELQYISPAFLPAQVLIAGVLLFVLNGSPAEGMRLREYLQWCSAAAAWMGAAGCSRPARHFLRGTAEVEQSCYFNLSQIWTIQMALSGTVNILILLLCSGMVAEKTSAVFWQVCLYVSVPFVLSNVCCLLFFTAMRGGRGRYGQFAAALATGPAALMPSAVFGEAYASRFLWVWAAVLLSGSALYLCQLRFMYGKIRRGEMLCRN